MLDAVRIGYGTNDLVDDVNAVTGIERDGCNRVSSLAFAARRGKAPTNNRQYSS